jgi:hypothetical protein
VLPERVGAVIIDSNTSFREGQMHTLRELKIILVIITAGLALMGCTPTPASPCMLTANMPVTAYRLPASTSDVFGTMPAGEIYAVLARTADGWLGFDPGVAQAGNIGLAHHRWVQLNLTPTPSCLDTVDLVTLADVEADLAASGQ